MSDTYLKLHDGFPEHRKVVAVGGDAAWLHVCALAYASRNLTDGLIPAGVVPRLSDRKAPKKLADKLQEAGLWHAADHGCQRCPQPGPDEYVIHDYLKHQRSAEKVEEIKTKRAVAGRTGGTRKAANARSGATSRGKQSSSNLLGGWQEPAEANGTPDTEEVLRTSRAETETEQHPPSGGDADDAHDPSDAAEPDDEEPGIRDDVERLCVHLADRIEANGSKRPNIGKTWRDAARLLIDLDRRTERQVHNMIDWCQNDDWWRSRVMSMPKLREKYDALRLQALPGGGQRTGNRGQPARSTTDERVAQAADLARRLAERDGIPHLREVPA